MYIAPKCWLFIKKKSFWCHWPGYGNVDKLIQSKAEIDIERCSKWEVKILYSDDEFNDALKRYTDLYGASAISQFEAYSGTGSDSSTEDDEDVQVVRKRIKKSTKSGDFTYGSDKGVGKKQNADRSKGGKGKGGKGSKKKKQAPITTPPNIPPLAVDRRKSPSPRPGSSRPRSPAPSDVASDTDHSVSVSSSESSDEEERSRHAKRSKRKHSKRDGIINLTFLKILF